MNNNRKRIKRNNTVTEIDALIGEKIKRFRLAKSINRSDVATALKLNEIEYSRIEKGLLRANAANLFAIANFLDVPIQNLIPNNEYVKPIGERPTSAEGHQLLTFFCDIRSPENRQILIEHAKKLAAK